MEEFESKIGEAFKHLDALKTPSCMDITTIGRYAEGKLRDVEKSKVELHIQSCLYCLNQLTELQELLYLESGALPVSTDLENRLNSLFEGQYKKDFQQSKSKKIFQTVRELLLYPLLQWRYSLVSVASICLTVLIIHFLFKPETSSITLPNINPDSFVDVRAMSNSGDVLSEAQGIFVSSQGLVASNLNQLAGATSIQIKLRDGRTYSTRNIWKDDDKNLAVMKIDSDKVPPVQLANLKEMSVGEYAYVVVDPNHPKKGLKEGVISDFKMYPGSRRGDELQYVQLATLTSTMKRGALVDKDGRIIGFLLTQEKNINLAVPLQNIEKLVKENKALPVSELKSINNPTEALNYYMKAILARDAQKWDEATGYFEKAVELNPDLAGAHLELGYLYYRKRLYEKEGEEYNAALRLNPQNTDALFYLAENLDTRGFYKQAITLYEKLLTLDPEDADTYYNLGLAYIADGQINKAMNIYPKLKLLNAGSADMLRRLAIRR
jgi:tetratricopeptide (TPR) repeat protein